MGAQFIFGDGQYARAVPATLHVEVGRHVAKLIRDERRIHRRGRREERRAHDESRAEKTCEVQGRVLLVAGIRVIDLGVVVSQDSSAQFVQLVGRDSFDTKLIVSQGVAPS